MHIIQKQGLTLGLLIMVVCFTPYPHVLDRYIIFCTHQHTPHAACLYCDSPINRYSHWLYVYYYISLVFLDILYMYISYIHTIVFIWSIGRSISFCSIIDFADQIWPLAQESSMWFWLHLGFNRKLFGVSWNMPIKPTIREEYHGKITMGISWESRGMGLQFDKNPGW